jgi:Family of unknown function (DUF6212)
MPLPATTGLRTVSCEVAIEDSRCRTPIECKLVVAAPEVSADQVEQEENVLASSGWTVVERPKEPHGLSAPLLRHSGPVSLHLFTRIPDGGPGLYGRTVFSRFELGIDGRAAWQMSPVFAAPCDEAG